MTAQQVRGRVLRNLLSNLGTIALCVVLAVAVVQLQPDAVIWAASALVWAFVPGFALDVWESAHFLLLRVGERDDAEDS